MMLAADVVGELQEVVLFSQMISRLPEPPLGDAQLEMLGAAVLQTVVLAAQFAPKPIVPALVTLSQTETGVPAQAQPPGCMTSLMVFGLPSLQAVPGTAGKAGLKGWQSWLLQTPSPSESPPWLAHGSPPVTGTVIFFSQMSAYPAV